MSAGPTAALARFDLERTRRALGLLERLDEVPSVAALMGALRG